MKEGVFRALGDPTRRRILELLARGDLTAGNLANEFPIAFASVSHHLNVLKAAGLVVSEREGQRIRYRLNTTTVQETVQYLVDTLHGGKRETGKGKGM